MEVLELKAIRNKKIKLYLIRSENLEFSPKELKELSAFLKEQKFRFAVVDFNDDDVKKYYETPLLEFLNKFKLPYYKVDIPDNARDYLYVEILEKEIQIKELENEYEHLCYDLNEKESFKAQNLKSWIYILKKEVETKKEYLEKTLRPQWIVKKILDISKMIQNDKFSIMHFTHGEIFKELKSLFEKHNIKVIKFDINNINIKQILVDTEV